MNLHLEAFMFPSMPDYEENEEPRRPNPTPTQGPIGPKKILPDGQRLWFWGSVGSYHEKGTLPPPVSTPGVVRLLESDVEYTQPPLAVHWQGQPPSQRFYLPWPED